MVCTRVDNPRARRPEELRRLLVDRLGFPAGQVECRDDPGEALAQALAQGREHELVIVTGSIYLVGAMRTRLRELGLTS